MIRRNALLLWMALIAAAALLGGCAAQEKTGAETKSCREIADAVMSAVSFQELTDMNEKYLERHLLIEAADLEDWVMRCDASRATPEMVLVARVKQGADGAALAQAFQEYLEEQLLLFRDYQPAQAYKLENARVLKNQAYLALIVSPDAEGAFSALGSGWKE